MSSCFSRCLRVPIAIRAFYESYLWILQTLLLTHPDLHPGLLGLVAGVSAFCKEFSAQHDIKIDFTPDATPKSVNPDVALCIFRIVQESLRNISKHSGASCAHVSLKVVDSTIHLAVSDDGVGFHPKDLKQNEGLGVRSMAERAHLLGGRFEIRSEARKGTIIDVRLPLHPRSSALTA